MKRYNETVIRFFPRIVLPFYADTLPKYVIEILSDQFFQCDSFLTDC